MPTNWPRVPLGEVCSLERRQVAPDAPGAAGLRYVGLEHIEPHTGRVLPPTDKEVIGTTFAFDARHVLYGKLRPYLNKVVPPDFAGRCSTELIPLAPSDRLDRRFLGWFLRQPWVADAATAGATGSRMPRAVVANLLAAPIPLPPPAEQRRVVARIDAVAERVAAVARLRGEADEEAAALFGASANELLNQGGPVVAIGSLNQVPIGTETFRYAPQG